MTDDEFDPTPANDDEARAAAYAVYADRTVYAPGRVALDSLSRREVELCEAAYAAGAAAVSERVEAVIGSAAETVRADVLRGSLGIRRAPRFHRQDPRCGHDQGAAQIVLLALRPAEYSEEQRARAEA